MSDMNELKESLNRYQNDRILPGSFLRAVLANDLFDAVARADPESLALIGDVVRYIHWELPSGCHGSREKIKAWEAGKEVAYPPTVRHYHFRPDRDCGRCGKDLTDPIHFWSNEVMMPAIGEQP